MPHDDFIALHPITPRTDPSHVVIRPFVPADDPPALVAKGWSRAQRISDRVLALDDAGLHAEFENMTVNLADRHSDVEHV